MNIRAAAKGDVLFLLALRNDPKVRINSFYSGLIELADHEKWFESKLASGRTLIFIAEVEGERIGQSRFDIGEDGSAEIHVSILPERWGMGYGTELLVMSCRETLSKGAARIVAHIKEGNIPSIKAFTKAGFKEAGRIDYKGHRTVEMVLCG